MSMHNPAPWEVIDGREGADMETDTIGHFRVEAVKMCFSPLIARVGFDNLFGSEHDEETGFANACLVAAAPEMHELLFEIKEARDKYVRSMRSEKMWAAFEKLDEVLAKAEGRDA